MSDDEEIEQIPDFIDEKGLCKYCRAKYIPKPKKYKF